MPLLLVGAVGFGAGFLASEKTNNLAKLALMGGALYVGGKMAKVW